MRYLIPMTISLLSALLYGAESDSDALPESVTKTLKKCHKRIEETFANTEGISISRIEATYFKHRSSFLFNAPALVSLLKEDSPQVYLPREAGKLKKRELDAFEKNALERLKKGEVLIAAYLPAESPTSESEKKIRGRIVQALGSIRARKSCLECHKVEVGTMLGAFSYRVPESEIKEPPGSE